MPDYSLDLVGQMDSASFASADAGSSTIAEFIYPLAEVCASSFFIYSETGSNLRR